MNTLILRTAARALRPVLLGFALWLLWRGHNAPGGGFIGGLVAGAVVVMHALAFGPAAARRALRTSPRVWMGVGLAVALFAALLGLIIGDGLLDAAWVDVPGVGPLGTPLIFDVGIFTAVVGAVAGFTLALWPDEESASDTASGGA